MITIQDWVATIPEEDRHLAYVGEHESVTRQFLLTGKDWEEYQDWGFHLDMAFDLSTVTTRDTRQMENTKVESSETVSDTLIKTSANTKKEKYTVSDVTVDCHSPTDIASLEKVFVEGGMILVWRVLRQHTQLPGRLWANIRALGNNGEVKKSSVMVFDVGASVNAEPAADIPQSELEAMEQHMDEMLIAVLRNAQTVESGVENVEQQLAVAKDFVERAEDTLIEVQNLSYDALLQVDGLSDRVQKVADDNATQEAAIGALMLDMKDMCTTYTGSVYSSAGEAVRSQTGMAMMEIGRLGSRVTTLEENTITVDAALSSSSTNPVQNKAVYASVDAANIRINQLQNKLTNFESKFNQLWSQLQNHLDNHA